MSGDERRDGVRFFTELGVILRDTPDGAPLDDRATAHEVSGKGFKLETQTPLAVGAVVFFVLELHTGGRAAGKGRVVWINRETLVTWAGIEIVSMPWGDSRRLKQILEPDKVDWPRLRSLTVWLVLVLTVLAAAQRLAHSPIERDVLRRLAPKILAVMVMGWALLGMLKRERR